MSFKSQPDTVIIGTSQKTSSLWDEGQWDDMLFDDLGADAVLIIGRSAQ